MTITELVKLLISSLKAEFVSTWQMAQIKKKLEIWQTYLAVNLEANKQLPQSFIDKMQLECGNTFIKYCSKNINIQKTIFQEFTSSTGSAKNMAEFLEQFSQQLSSIANVAPVVAVNNSATVFQGIGRRLRDEPIATAAVSAASSAASRSSAVRPAIPAGLEAGLGRQRQHEPAAVVSYQAAANSNFRPFEGTAYRLGVEPKPITWSYMSSFAALASGAGLVYGAYQLYRNQHQVKARIAELTIKLSTKLFTP